jgi:hypothetical protein
MLRIDCPECPACAYIGEERVLEYLALIEGARLSGVLDKDEMSLPISEIGVTRRSA